MSVHTPVAFSDLSFEKKQELIEWVKTLLIEDYLYKGDEILRDSNNRHWHVAPRTKEEAYCRLYAIGSSSWSDLDEDSQEFKDFDWTFELTQHAEAEAEKKLEKAFKYTEVEIELK